MDLNSYKPGSPTKSQKTSIQPTYNQDRTWSSVAITDYIQSSQNIVLHHIGVLNKVITNQFSSGSKVVLKHHTYSLITCQFNSHPSKSTTEDKEDDHGHDLFIVRSRIKTVSTVAVINDIICNKGK